MFYFYFEYMYGVNHFFEDYKLNKTYMFEINSESEKIKVIFLNFSQYILKLSCNSAYIGNSVALLIELLQ